MFLPIFILHMFSFPMKYLLHGQFHQEVLQSSHLQLKTKFIIHFFKKQTKEALLLFLLLASGDGVAIHLDLHLFAQAGDLTVPTDTFEQSLSPVHSPQHPSPCFRPSALAWPFITSQSTFAVACSWVSAPSFCPHSSLSPLPPTKCSVTVSSLHKSCGKLFIALK